MENFEGFNINLDNSNDEEEPTDSGLYDLEGDAPDAATNPDDEEDDGPDIEDSFDDQNPY